MFWERGDEYWLTRKSKPRVTRLTKFSQTTQEKVLSQNTLGYTLPPALPHFHLRPSTLQTYRNQGAYLYRERNKVLTTICRSDRPRVISVVTSFSRSQSPTNAFAAPLSDLHSAKVLLFRFSHSNQAQFSIHLLGLQIFWYQVLRITAKSRIVKFSYVSTRLYLFKIKSCATRIPGR